MEIIPYVYLFLYKIKKIFFILVKGWVQWVQSLELLCTNTYSFIFVPYPPK